MPLTEVPPAKYFIVIVLMVRVYEAKAKVSEILRRVTAAASVTIFFLPPAVRSRRSLPTMLRLRKGRPLPKS